MTDRVSARNDVAQQWASRRRQDENSSPREIPSISQQASIVPSLCYVIGKAWQDTLANLSSALSQSPKAIKQAPSKREGGKKSGVFPSVLQILKASALQEQVSQFGAPQDGTNNDLQVLPSGYDFDRAIWNMANSRSRAFLLLDLACIVPTLVQWREGQEHVVQFLYTVQLNADPKLLQLLQRSRVGLVCTNKWDLQKCRESCGGSEAPIYDNCTQTGKPDGYLRQLVLDAQVQTVAIDGASEVHRIVAALDRMKKRRNEPNDKKQPNFILRLPSNKDKWDGLMQSTEEAIAQHASCSLVGISLDVSNADPEVFSQIKKILRLIPNPRLDLTGVPMPPSENMVQWWSTLSQEGLVSQVTVDVSHSLVSPAGALCARIIGVKEETISSKDDDNSTTTGLRRHYYIDDGCYGSLYHAKEHDAISDPLPLANDTDTESTPYYTSTVWGPTCDGLDRVCRDIPLPKLHRDQWLVFPNLGCRIGDGLGTDFNGFAPPDTVYCVLGYFGK